MKILMTLLFMMIHCSCVWAMYWLGKRSGHREVLSHFLRRAEEDRFHESFRHWIYLAYEKKFWTKFDEWAWRQHEKLGMGKRGKKEKARARNGGDRY